MQIAQQIYVAEEWNKKTYIQVQAEVNACTETEKALGSLKDECFQISEQLKQEVKEKKSLEAGLKNAQEQAED